MAGDRRKEAIAEHTLVVGASAARVRPGARLAASRPGVLNRATDTAVTSTDPPSACDFSRGPRGRTCGIRDRSLAGGCHAAPYPPKDEVGRIL